MRREEFIDAVTQRIGDRAAAEEAVAAFCEIVMTAVTAGEPVVLRGFGRWTRVLRPPSLGAPATHVPRFQADRPRT